MERVELIAPCHFGLESVLKREILDLGYEIVKVEDGRVTFQGDMKAVCTAAKDCQGPNQSFIAGEKGWLEFQGPISQGPGYVITLRTGEVIQRSFGTEIHRMTPEFLAFQDRIDKARPKQGEALLDISGEAVKILSRTRPY